MHKEEEACCRGGVLPVGETSRSDSGGGVSAEECSSRGKALVNAISVEEMYVFVVMVSSGA